MSDNLKHASGYTKTVRDYLTLALNEAGALEALAIMPMLETTARLLQDLDALQSAVRADSKREGMSDIKVRHGGLYRCCLKTLEERAADGTLPTGIDDTIGCRYHKDIYEPVMVLAKDGVWQWLGTP